MSEKLYKLELIIFIGNASLAKTKERLRKELGDLFDRTQVEIQNIDKGKFVIFAATDEIINSIHRLLIRKNPSLKFVRVHDELCDELRVRMYPLLAETEGKLRAFVNRSLTCVFSAKWSELLIPKTKGFEDDYYHHPIEKITFEQLSKLFEKKISRMIDPDLKKEIISIIEVRPDDEISKNITIALREISLWDEVFSRYFDDISDVWAEHREYLKRSIDTRNKVMHHRPVFIDDYLALKKGNDAFVELIDSARQLLSHVERAEIYRESIKIFKGAVVEQAQALQNAVKEVGAVATKFAAMDSKELEREFKQALLKHPLFVLPEYSELNKLFLKSVGGRQHFFGQFAKPQVLDLY
ncbi:MAG: hypothetical protein WCP79_03525, partial [Bacillota bacterium]